MSQDPLRRIVVLTAVLSALAGIVVGLALGYPWGRLEVLDTCIDEPGPYMTCADQD
jgi:hypothetical protein